MGATSTDVEASTLKQASARDLDGPHAVAAIWLCFMMRQESPAAQVSIAQHRDAASANHSEAEAACICKPRGAEWTPRQQSGSWP